MELEPDHNQDHSTTDRSHIYWGVVLALIILVMGYLTLFVDDPWKFFRRTEAPVAVSKDKSELLNQTSVMSDEEVRQSLVRFIEAFYFDQRRGYFDPPSYFANITETFYNYHNLTYTRLKEIYWKRRDDMQNLERTWNVSSLDFKRVDGHIVATYWAKESYFSPSQNAQNSVEVNYELIINADGKIVSLKELDTGNFESHSRNADVVSMADSSGTEISAPVSETPSAVEDKASQGVPAEVSDQKVYELGTVEVPPEYPGGQKELVKFLSKNLRYPNQARQGQVEGRVFAGFIIEKNGTLSDLKVLRGIGSGCDEEALRVIRMLPAWKPATIDGKPVRNAYVLSVTFRFSE